MVKDSIEICLLSQTICIGEEGSLVHGVVVDGVLEGVIYSHG